MEKSRVELFELDWSKPMTHLSKELGLSDVGLRKICVKYGIPLPAKGYWARLQFGKQDPRPELPFENNNPQIEESWGLEFINEEHDPDFDESFQDERLTFGC